ncbi:MAG: hypothetical protein WBA12_04485 [Catalinimonas sp.]
MKYALWLLLLCGAARAQSWLPVGRFPVGRVAQASLDPTGYLYVSDERGSMVRYDSLGTPVARYSPPKVAEPSLLEAANPLQTFVFYRDFQEFHFLDRFLNASPTMRLPADAVSFAAAATPAANGRLWVFDATAFALLQWDLNARAVGASTPLDLALFGGALDVNFMREYQNQLFVNNRGGSVLVFDNFGNYRKQLPVACDFFGFRGSELYWLDGDQLRAMDLYTLQRRVLKLPALVNVERALLSRQHLYLFSGDELFIYRDVAPRH